MHNYPSIHPHTLHEYMCSAAPMHPPTRPPEAPPVLTRRRNTLLGAQCVTASAEASVRDVRALSADVRASVHAALVRGARVGADLVAFARLCAGVLARCFRHDHDARAGMYLAARLTHLPCAAAKLLDGVVGALLRFDVVRGAGELQAARVAFCERLGAEDALGALVLRAVCGAGLCACERGQGAREAMNVCTVLGLAETLAHACPCGCRPLLLGIDARCRALMRARTPVLPFMLLGRLRFVVLGCTHAHATADEGTHRSRPALAQGTQHPTGNETTRHEGTRNGTTTPAQETPHHTGNGGGTGEPRRTRHDGDVK